MLNGILLTLLAAGAALQPLFVLGRSTNANVVVYSAELGPDGGIDPRKPLEAHWVMKAQDGRIEALNEIERKLAYGFSAKPAGPGQWVVTLNAFRDRPLTLMHLSDGWHLVTSVGGAPSVLQRAFVTATDELDVPEVKSCELWGKSVIDGSPTREILRPRKKRARRWDGDGSW